MGEKIRDIGKFKIGEEVVKIELNNGYDEKYSKYDIHIQSEHMQYCLTNRDYIKLATNIISANEKLKSLKNYSTKK